MDKSENIVSFQSQEGSTVITRNANFGTSLEESNDDFYFGKFCKHVPRILRRQLVKKLVNQYMESSAELMGVSDDREERPLTDKVATSSIVRFHGTLLFVDISGFTVLSQKLKVDDLKNQINAYFQKIVDIINKYDGEIIKFAGDALFIIWQTETNDTGKKGSDCDSNKSLPFTSTINLCAKQMTMTSCVSQEKQQRKL